MGMRTYNLTIEATADWNIALVEGGKFVRAAGNSMTVRAEGEPLGAFDFSDDRIGLFRRQFQSGRITARLQLESEHPTVRITLGHGDNGTIRVSSDVDTIINDRNLGDGQNSLRFTLHLTRDALSDFHQQSQTTLVERGEILPKP